MTENELIELVETRLPDELTSDELARLESGLAHSSALREALAARLELESGLHATIGNHAPSAEKILARARVAPASRARAAVVRWSLCMGLLGLTALLVARAIVLQHRAANGQGEPTFAAPRHAASPSDELAAEEATPANAAAIARAAAALAIAKPAAPLPPGETLPAAGALPAAGVLAVENAVAQAPAPPAPPREPWAPLAAIASEPAPDEAQLADDLIVSTPAPSEAELRLWLAEVPGHPISFWAHNHFGVNCGGFSGLVRLRSPWAPRAALRMTLHEYQRFRIHFWSEHDGVTLNFLHNFNHAWFAYRATRKPGQAMPETLLLIGDDQGRNARANASQVDNDTFDLNCDGKTLSLSRRGLVFLRVPFEGLPSEVYFEGKAGVRQMQLVRAVALPADPPQAPAVRDIGEPAQQTWTTDLGEGAAFKSLADGRVELSLEKSGKTAWASLPLANDRIQEVLFELDDPQPGCGVFLGDASGKATGGLGFFRDQRTGRTCVGQGNPADQRWETNIDANDAIQSYCSPKPWVKMLVGCGLNYFWISPDGMHWARCCEPWTQQRVVIGSMGIYCVPGQQPRSVRLRRLMVRELPALAALVPLELRRQAPVPTADLAPSEWLGTVCASQPAGVAARQWRRACALRTLAANATCSSAATVLDNLVEDILAETDRPWSERLRLLDETCNLRPCWDDPRLAQRCEAHYARLGLQAVRAGHPEALANALAAQLASPLLTRQEPVQAIEPADVEQLLQLVYDHQWPQAQTLLRDLRWTRRLNPSQEGILDWADSLAPREAAPRGAGKTLLKPEWRQPLITELSKEAFNVLAELEAALAGKAYHDACQIISTTGNQAAAGGPIPAGGPGLLPDMHDADLLLSFPNAVLLAMREHPALATTMNNQFGAGGRLRVRQAITEDDAESVEAATVQFCGTQAAAEAHLWLGDRALARGAFAQAISHYDACEESASPETHAKAASGARLAAAMTGRKAPEGAVAAAEFGDLRLSATQFSQLLDDLRQVRAASGSSRQTLLSVVPAGAPAPSGFAVTVRGRLDGDSGDSPQNVPGEMRKYGVDWVARQTTVTPVGARLLISNRFQVSAFNIQSGQWDWRAGLGGEQGAAHDWSLSPMRPLVTANRVFVRRLTKQGPVLAAFDWADGKVIWTTRPEPEKYLISDAALIQDQLFAISAARVDQEFVLSLASFDPASGAAISSRPIARLRESWWQQQRSCQVAPLDEGLIVACAGSVLRVDVAGHVGWLRREIWTPASLDGSAIAQDQSPPVIAGDRLFVAQPAVRDVQCLDVESGRLVWHLALPTLRRIVGLAGQRLLVQTDAGFAALGAADGKVLWERPLDGLLDGQLLAGASTLLATQGVPAGDDRNFTPTLVWIDLANGREMASWGLDALRHDHPLLGPLIVAEGRLFALFGRGEQEPHRDILELAAQGAAWRAPALEPADAAIWRRPLDSALRDAVAEILPHWILLGGPTYKKHPLRVAEWQGESRILEVQASPGWPFSLARRIQIPPGTPKLVARVASDAKWKLEIQAGSQAIASQAIDREKLGPGWKDLEWSLEPVAGQTVWLVVRQIDLDGSQPLVKWKSLDIRD